MYINKYNIHGNGIGPEKVGE